MSRKICDNKNRWRSKTVAFRMSPKESEQLDVFVKLTGLNKQDYLISRVLQRDVIVSGNPRVFKALRNQLFAVLEELQRISNGKQIDNELMDIIRLINITLKGLKEEN